MVVVLFSSTHGSGFLRAIKVALFFLISMSVLDSGSGCWSSSPSTRSSDHTNEKSVKIFQNEYREKLRNCDTKFVKLLVSDPNKAAQELMKSWQKLVAEAYNETLARSDYYDPEKGDTDRESIKQNADFEFKTKKQDGHACLDDILPDKNNEKLCDKSWDHAKVNKIISKQIGHLCKSGKCHFHHKQLEFVCGSTSLQAMAGLLVAAMFFLGL